MGRFTPIVQKSSRKLNKIPGNSTVFAEGKLTRKFGVVDETFIFDAIALLLITLTPISIDIYNKCVKIFLRIAGLCPQFTEKQTHAVIIARLNRINL